MSVFKKGEVWELIDCESMGMIDGLFGVYNGATWKVMEDTDIEQVGACGYIIVEEYIKLGYIKLISESHNKITPRSLGCFQQVANVIGGQAAEIELWKVIDCGGECNLSVTNSYVDDAFVWDDAPQGYSFWLSIDGGKLPQKYLDTEATSPLFKPRGGLVIHEGYQPELTAGTPQKPNHYQVLPEYRVKDINKALLDKIEESDFEMSLNEAGWYQQSMQYFMRFYAKNGLEDLKKGVETMLIVIESLESKQEDKS